MECQAVLVLARVQALAPQQAHALENVLQAPTVAVPVLQLAQQELVLVELVAALAPQQAHALENVLQAPTVAVPVLQLAQQELVLVELVVALAVSEILATMEMLAQLETLIERQVVLLAQEPIKIVMMENLAQTILAIVLPDVFIPIIALAIKNAI
jgi:hypothetical protein